MAVVAPVVHSVSGIGSDSPLASWMNHGVTYDYAIGGLPFLSKVNTNFPIQRKTADYTKQQIDQTTQPGEQTLVNWWLRSQSSFHAGTGIIYEEPTGQIDDTIPYRFADAEGVDVWTPGEVSLLPAVDHVFTSSTLSAMVGLGDGRAVTIDGSNLKVIDLVTGSVTHTVGGLHGPVTSDGTNWYAVGIDGIYTGLTTGVAAPTKIWDLPSGGGIVVLKWVKDRLMMGADMTTGCAIYELASGGGTTLPTPVYTSASAFVTDIAESPQAIYVSLNAAGRGGVILMFVLDTSGLVPVLTGGIMASELPEGETISCLYGHLGTYVAIGTSRGIRIATVQTDGTLAYGPISIPLPVEGSRQGCIVGVDRFLYGSLDAGFSDIHSGLWRLDLGTTVGDRQYAWAKDLKSPFSSNALIGLAAWSNGTPRISFAQSGAGIYTSSAVDSVESGMLTTGNIRFHMLEPKLFKYVKVFTKPYGANASIPNAAVSITATTNGGSVVAIGEHVAPFIVVAPIVPTRDTFPNQFGPHEWVSLTFTLTAASGGQSGINPALPGRSPIMTGYQLTALPAQKRQRTIVLPLSCYDHEKDSNGTSLGFEGSAFDRMRALEALEEAGDIVLLNDLTKNGEGSRQVIIDNLNFIQDVSPSTDQGGSGWGGIILATLRAVD